MNYKEIKLKLKELGFTENDKTYTKNLSFGRLNVIFELAFIKGEFVQMNSAAKDVVYFDWKEDIGSARGFSAWLLYYINNGIIDNKSGSIGYQNYVES